MAFARRMVMQHATDWKNVAAEVIPIGVEDCSALYTYVSIIAVVLKMTRHATWEGWDNTLKAE